MIFEFLNSYIMYRSSILKNTFAPSLQLYDYEDLSQREHLQKIIHLKQQLERSIHQQQEDDIDSILFSVVELIKPDLSAHMQRVGNLSAWLMEEMGGNQEEVKRVESAGCLHDLGKVFISTNIQDKPTALTASEWGMMQLHPILSCRALEHFPKLAPIVLTILHHHERYAGGGYPGFLKGKAIPLTSRVITIVDAFDSMTHPRKYRIKSFSISEALEEIDRQKGYQFDPELTDLFIRLIETNWKKDS